MATHSGYLWRVSAALSLFLPVLLLVRMTDLLVEGLSIAKLVWAWVLPIFASMLFLYFDGEFRISLFSCLFKRIEFLNFMLIDCDNGTPWVGL